MHEQRSEKGQAVVLIVLAIVAIFGFAALAVDMGRVYSERRRSQSAADAAAMAAAFTSVDSGDYQTNALQIARTNGFDNNGTTNTVTVNHPPVSGPYAGNEEYYQVIVTQNVPPTFSQIVFNGNQQITTEAVSRAVPSQGISPGNAIHALDHSSGALRVNGNIDLDVFKGDIVSNGGAIKDGGSGEVTVSEGHIFTATGWSNERGVSPAPQIAPAKEVNDPPTPDCNLPARSVSQNMQPGVYVSGINIQGNGTYTMAPGIYCVDNGISIRGNTEVNGDGIFIYLRSGELRINGTSTIHWKRANDLKDPSGNQWGGMLIHLPRTNREPVVLTGNNGSMFIGMVYAPRSMCEAGGNNTTLGLHTSIICKRITLHGNPNMDIFYREPENYQLPPIVELAQ